MFLKFRAAFIFLIFAIQCQAATYYFSANGNDSYTSAQAQSSSTPWQTINKLNSYFSNIKPGDSILFKCGETFTGSINITQSGTSGNPIVISSYGTGSKPVISGLITITGWSSAGSGIYQANCPVTAPKVNVVILNGSPQPIGRYPNVDAADSGYLNVDSHVGNSSITSSALNTAVNWTGAEVVIRKNHWTIDRGTIVSNTSNTIAYTDNSSFSPLNNFGFFIQNSSKTLDEQGEWYYNTSSKKLQIYNGSSSPAAYNIQAGSVDSLIYIKNKNYITISGLSFYGANTNAIQLLNTNYITIQNCDINYAGIGGVNATNVNYMTISNNTIQGSNSIGITFYGAHCTIKGNTIKNIGTVAGMGQNMDPAYQGIAFNGNGNTITNNDIENIGDDGITFKGDSITIKNNFIKNFTLVKDDGGGIYIWGSQDTLVNDYARNITSNIILNGNAASDGTTGYFQACSVGIYLDDNSSGVTLTGNTVSGCPGGIKLHNAHDNALTSNTLFNNALQLINAHDQTTLTLKNNTVKNNILFSKYSSQPALVVNSFKNDVGALGTYNNNSYSNVIDNTFQFTVLNKAINLPMWQNLYGKDINSNVAVPIPYYDLSQTAKRSKFKNSTFTTNVTGALSYSSNGNFKIAWQTKLDAGSLYGYFTPITGSSNYSASITADIGSINAQSLYVVKFSLLGTKTARRIMVYLINTASPYNAITEKQYAMIDVNRTENTFTFTPYTSSPDATLVIAVENEDQSFWIDNLGVYQASGTLSDPDNYLLFEYNNTSSNKTISLAGSYVDAKNNIYSGSTTIPPFSSILLIKNADTVSTAPPIVYDAPNSSKDITAFDSSLSPPKISVYPNPTTDHIAFNLNNPNVKTVNVNIMDSHGDIILSKKVQVFNNDYQIYFPSKPQPGYYFIQLTGDGINQTSKFIVM